MIAADTHDHPQGGVASTASMYRHQPERHVAVVAVLGTMGWLGALALVLL